MLDSDNDQGLEELALQVVRRALDPEATDPSRVSLDAAALVIGSEELGREPDVEEELGAVLDHLGDGE